MGFLFAQVETHKAVQSDASIQQTKANIVMLKHNEKGTSRAGPPAGSRTTLHTTKSAGWGAQA